MKFSVLGSSSQGNATILINNGRCYLLDAGLGVRALYNRLNLLNAFVDQIDAIFITHEHTDHISGLSSIVKKYNSTIYMSKKAYQNMDIKVKEQISPINFKFIKPDTEFIVDDMTVKTFSVSHDSAEPMGFSFISQDKKLTYITDTGILKVNEELVNSDAYILESNHEEALLLNSQRPWLLKERILGEYGHLSNALSAELFSKLRGPKTKNLVLFHLSQECNSDILALTEYKRYFKSINVSLDDLNIVVSDRSKPTQFIEV